MTKSDTIIIEGGKRNNNCNLNTCKLRKFFKVNGFPQMRKNLGNNMSEKIIIFYI